MHSCLCVVWCIPSSVLMLLHVHYEITNGCIDQVLEDFLNQNKDGEINKENALNFDFQEEDFKDLLKELRSIDEENQSQIYALANFRQPELCDESSVSSECSTGSTAYELPVNNETAQVDDHEQLLSEADNFQSSEELINEAKAVSESSNVEFGSPLQVTPLFRSLAAGIPSPKFSESVSHLYIYFYISYTSVKTLKLSRVYAN